MIYEELSLQTLAQRINEIETDTPIPISKGGTGATTAEEARTNLGLANVASSGIYNDLIAIPFKTVSNSQELRNAVESLADTGGMVYLMPGVFDLTDNGFTITKDNITLVGSGKDTILKLGKNRSFLFSGNYCAIKNLTITREVTSAYNIIGLTSTSATQKAKGFLMDNVYIDCLKANASAGFISVTSTEANIRFSNIIINTDEANKLIYYIGGAGGGKITGVIWGCISNADLTVPSTITLGANINIENAT